MSWLFTLISIAAGMMLVGCGASPLGEEFRKTLTLERLRDAAWESLKTPDVLVPAIGAGVFAIDDWDQKVSDWATRNTPIFGDIDDAEDASDILRDVARGSALLAWGTRPVRATDRSDDAMNEGESDDGRPVVNEGDGIDGSGGGDAPDQLDAPYTRTQWVRDGVLGAAAFGLTDVTTSELKDLTKRERPNEGNDNSFPSAHASGTATPATLARHHLRRNDHVPQAARDIGNVALVVLPYATGWARVEADKHYPSDVLFGIALGNFFAMTANKLAERRERDRDPLEPVTTVYAAPGGDGTSVILGISITF